MVGKVEKTMHEFKRGQLHSGSKRGPVVTNPEQAVAIGLSEAREAGENVPPPPRSGARPRGSRAVHAVRARRHRA